MDRRKGKPSVKPMGEVGFALAGLAIVAAVHGLAPSSAREAALATALFAWGLGGRMLAACSVRRARRRASAESNLDPISKALNAKGFVSALERDVGLASRRAAALSLVVIHMENLPNVNADFDRAEGDGLVAAVAMAAQRCLRETDCLGRVSGLVLCALLPEADPEAAQAVADRARTAIAEILRSHAKGEVRAICSVAQTSWDGEESAAELLERAVALVAPGSASAL